MVEIRLLICSKWSIDNHMAFEQKMRLSWSLGNVALLHLNKEEI